MDKAKTLVGVAFTFIFAVASYSLLSLLFASPALAFSYSAYTNTHHYVINDTINVSAVADVSMNNTNVSIYLINSTNYLFNNVTINMSLTANTTIIANVTKGGDYLLKTNFTFNTTYYETSILMKISKATTFVISTDKSVYDPAGKINFTVKATDKNSAGVSGESITVRMIYKANDSTITSASGTTDASGEFSGQLTAPSQTGTYRLVVNDWLATKVFDVSAFDLLVFTGDVSGNVKSSYGVNDTAYVFVDLLSNNKTKYTNTESISVNITYPNGTSNSSTYTYSGTRLNTTADLSVNGTYNVQVQPASTARSIELSFKAQLFELRGSLESLTRGATTSFFPEETVTAVVKVYNVSSGEVSTRSFSNGIWSITVLDSNLNLVNTTSNYSVKTSANEYKFNFTAPNTSSLYFVKIKLNNTEYFLDFTVKGTAAEATPVDSDYNFRNVFVGNKQKIRIITTLTNSTGAVNVTSIGAIEVRDQNGKNINSSLTMNASIVTYKGNAAGLIEFSAPSDSGWYFIKTIANSNFAADTQFLVKLYSVCAQLSGYRWFISASENAIMTLKITEAKDIGFVESIAGNKTASSTNTTSGFGSMYGMQDCYGTAYSTVSGSSSQGNATSNVRVSVSKIINTQTFEDVTSKASSSVSNSSDSNGTVLVNITKPSNGWDSGSYIVEFTVRDQNNNTDKGWGFFNVKTLWINIWPKQYSGYWKWFFSPTENMSFDVFAYNSTNTWYSYNNANGVGDNCYLLDVFYQGDGTNWFWPPKPVSKSSYNWTCANTTVGQGKFTLNVSGNTTSGFNTGYYMVRIKVNTTAGAFDTGDGWYSVKAYNVYMRSSTSNYYDTWYRNTTENVTFWVDITNATSTLYSCYWSVCPASERSPGQINVTVKKLIRYDQWQPIDYSSTKYNITINNGTVSAITTLNVSNGTANITLTPRSGSGSDAWETGYYSMVVEVSGPAGTETATGWFEIRSFFAELTTVNGNGSQYKSSFRPGQNITVNVSTTSKPKWLSSYYSVNITNVNTTITGTKLSYYSPTDYKMVSIPINYTPTTINGTTVVNVTSQTSLTGGYWYNLEMTLRDDSGNEQTAYTSFEIKQFTFSTQTSNWKWEFTNIENITLQAIVCDENNYYCYTGSTYTGSNVNVTVSNVYRTDSYPYSAVSGWTADSKQATSSTNNATINIQQTTAFKSGYYMAEVTAKFADGSGSTQRQNVWFSIKSYTLTALPIKYEFTMSEDVTIQFNSSTALTLSSAVISCGYYPSQTTYTLSSNLAANSTSISAGSTAIKLTPSGSIWTNGYCYGSVSATDGSDTLNTNIYFNMKGFTLTSYSNKYNILPNESLIINISTDSGRTINISNINITQWDYGNSYSYSSSRSDLTLNTTQITTSGYINITFTAGNWPRYGWYSGQIDATDNTNANIRQNSWFGFSIPAPLTAWGTTQWPNGNYRTLNTSSSSQNNITIAMYVSKYNYTLGYYANAPNVNVSLIKIEREDCSSSPCTYSQVSGITVTNGSSGSGTDSYAYINISKSSVWEYGGHRAFFFLNDTSSALTYNQSAAWFWVYQG